MFWLEKLFSGSKKDPVNNLATKSYFDSEIGDFAIWNDKYSDKNAISKIGYGELINIYTGWIYSCINVRANSLASLEANLHPSRIKTDSILENDVMDLIDWELKKAISSVLDLFGTCYILKETVGARVVGFKILRSDTVRAIQTEEGIIQRYDFHSWKRTYHFATNQIIAIHQFNPGQSYPNVTNGVSPAMAVAKQQIMDMMAIEYNYLFFKEGGKPGTILTTEKTIDNDAKNAIISKWNRFFAGLKNSHKTAVLDKGLKYQATTVGQKEMEFAKQREFTREEILGMFWVPLPLLGKSDGVGFADRQVPEYYFQKYHLLPLARQIENAFNKQLFNGKGFFTFGNVVSADLAGLNDLFDKGAITINELRTANNYGNIAGGNVNNAGTVFEVEVVKPKSIFDSSDLKILGKGFEALKKKSRDDYGEKILQATWKRADQYEIEMKKEIISIWSDQEKLIIDNVKSAKSVKDFIKKAEEDEDEIFNGLVVGVMWLAGKMQKILKKAIEKEGDIAYALTEKPGEFNADKLDNWIKTDVNKFGKQIDKTTKKTILKKVTEGYEAGNWEKETIKVIQDEFKTFKKSRLQTIVRTESTKAVGRANMEAYKQAGIEYKEWYATIDERTTTQCAQLHGSIIKVWESFAKVGDVVGGITVDYENIDHPPLHVNCRSILLPVL